MIRMFWKYTFQLLWLLFASGVMFLTAACLRRACKAQYSCSWPQHTGEWTLGQPHASFNAHPSKLQSHPLSAPKTTSPQQKTCHPTASNQTAGSVDPQIWLCSPDRVVPQQVTPTPNQQRNTYLEQVGHPLRASLRHFVGYQDRVPLCLWIFDVACHFVFTANEVVSCRDVFLDILIGMIRAAFDHLCSTANTTIVCQQLASDHKVICPSQAMLKRAGRVHPSSFFFFYMCVCVCVCVCLCHSYYFFS